MLYPLAQKYYPGTETAAGLENGFVFRQVFQESVPDIPFGASSNFLGNGMFVPEVRLLLRDIPYGIYFFHVEYPLLIPADMVYKRSWFPITEYICNCHIILPGNSIDVTHI